MTSTRLLRIKQVQQLTSLSKSYIYQLCNQNQFPKSIPLVKGGTAVAWVESEILAFIESRIKARDEGEV
jgi:prophage regulatory protein